MARTPAFLRRTQAAISSHKQRLHAIQPGCRLDYSVEDLRTLVSESLHAGCRYCGGRLDETNFSCDHILPTSRGGSYLFDNLEIICRHCNESKGGLTGEEYAILWTALRQMDSPGRMNVLARLRAAGTLLGQCKKTQRQRKWF